MSLNQYRFFNKYRIGIAIFFFLSLFVAFFVIHGLYDITFGFDLTAPDIAADPISTRHALIEQRTTMDCWADVYLYIMIAIPVLSFGLSALFFREKQGLFFYRYTRGQSHKRVVLSSIFTHAAINGLYFYLAYLLYFTIGYLAFGPDIDLSRTTLDGIFGLNFCSNHPFFYYAIEGFFLYFTASFIYTWLACSIGMLTNRVHHIVLIPACFYFGLSLFIGYIFPAGMKFVYLFQPFKFVYFSLVDWGLLEALTPQLLPLIIAAVLTMLALQKGEKINA